MNKLQKEYDEFGPWLSEILDESDITHEFEQVKGEVLACDLAFKIPMDKEWRTVDKGELLYDSMITMDGSSIRYYRIIDGAAFCSHIDYGDIIYICLNEDMLSCKMEIGTQSERLHIQYLPSPLALANRFISNLYDQFEIQAKEPLITMRNKTTHLKYVKNQGFSDAKIDELLMTTVG